MENMYSFMTVLELKNELRRRNAPITGRKADLIERLKAYDRNQNFAANVDSHEEDMFESPSSGLFKVINADSSLPTITKREIQDYFERYHAKPKWDILYESRHLLNARVYVEIKNSTNIYHVRGECKASMKKLSYVVNLKLSDEGIEESHCECVAGSGVHACCKHVAVLLLGVHDILYNKVIKLHQSCTQTLMTFNRPKKVFYNSPVAAQNLPHKRLKSINYNPLNENDVIENYADYVLNQAIGYGESSMPILQLRDPANPHGIEWDHYPCLETSPQEMLLEKLLLKNIKPEQITEVERNTKAQADSIEWHERRTCRVTASMFYTVCHASSYKSILQRILAPRTVHSRAITHGKIHEPVAIAKYESMFKIEVESCGLFISKEFPFLAASPDGLVGDQSVVEVKCPYTPRNLLINEVSVPYLKKDEGVLKLNQKHPYYSQIQGQLYCTGRQYCHFIVYTFVDMKVITIERNESFISEMLNNLINFNLHHLEPAILNKYIYKNYLSLLK